MKKRLASLLTTAAVLTTMVLSGCGSKPADTPSGDDDKVKDSQVEIRVAWWGDAKRNELYNQILDAFEVENPNIKTVREPQGWGDYWDKFKVQSASGGAPDFFGMHPQFASDYIRRGIIEPLDKYVKDGTIDTSKWEKTSIATGTVDGVVYMIPMGLTSASMFVNTTMLEDLGVKAPDMNWTFDDYRNIGLEVRKAADAKGQKNVWFANDASGAYQFFRYWARQNGKDLYTSDGKIAFNEEDLISWFTMWNDFRDNGIVPDAATTTEYARAVLQDNLFAKKMVATSSVPVNQLTQWTAAVPDSKIIVVRHPSQAGKQVGEYIEGAHFAISSKTSDEKKVAAAKLMNFWVNNETSIKLFKLDQGVPGNTEMAEAIIPLLQPVDKNVIDYVGEVSKIARPTTFPPAGASEINGLFETIAEEVRFGAKTPDKAAAEFVSKAQDIIKASN
jgi:multiple sugar transport system substrate-binding protein